MIEIHGSQGQLDAVFYRPNQNPMAQQGAGKTQYWRTGE
jgi:hypothetical protein